MTPPDTKLKSHFSKTLAYLKQEFEICSKLQLSVLDNAHLLPYSVVAMIFPNLVDRFGGMNMLTAAFGGAGAMVAAVYMTGFADIEYQSGLFEIQYIFEHPSF